jgi:hypothetical protein
MQSPSINLDPLEFRELAISTLSDLFHVCDELGIDPRRVIAEGYGQYLREKEESRG